MNHLSSDIGVSSTERTKVENLAQRTFKNNKNKMANKQISSMSKMKNKAKIKTEQKYKQTKGVLKIKKEHLRLAKEQKETSEAKLPTLPAIKKEVENKPPFNEHLNSAISFNTGPSLLQFEQMESQAFLPLQQGNIMNFVRNPYFNRYHKAFNQASFYNFPKALSPSIMGPFPNEIHQFEKKSKIVFYSTNNMTPLDYFKILLNEEQFFENILNETNNFHLLTPNLNQKIGFNSIMKFFGILLFSELVEIENIYDFWNENGLFGRFPIKNVLQENIFFTIFENIAKLNSKKNPDWVLDVINIQNKKNYVPSSNLVIHDRIIEIDSALVNSYYLIDPENDYIFYSKLFTNKPMEYEFIKSSFCQITFQKFIYFKDEIDSKILATCVSPYEKLFFCGFTQQETSENTNYENNTNENRIVTNFPRLIIDRLCKTSDRCIELSQALENKLECIRKIEKTNLFLRGKNNIFKSLSNVVYSLKVAITNSYVLYKLACLKNNIEPQQLKTFKVELIQLLMDQKI